MAIAIGNRVWVPEHDNWTRRQAKHAESYGVAVYVCAHFVTVYFGDGVRVRYPRGVLLILDE